MNKEEFLEEFKQHQLKLYSVDINGKNIANSDVLSILLNKFINLNYQEWSHQGKIKSSLDIRFQTLFRVELASVHYLQSIQSTIHDFNYIYEITERLGYLTEATVDIIRLREVSLRTSFLDKVFFAIDYFIQRMNYHMAFHTSSTSHKKQHYFKLLLEHLEIDDKMISLNSIIDDLNKHITIDSIRNLFIKGNDRKIQLCEVYDYLVSFRNVAHNNGYSQKNLNSINIGGIDFSMKKGEQLIIGHEHVVILTYMMLIPIVKIMEASFNKYNDQFWEDPYTKEIKELVENK